MSKNTHTGVGSDRRPVNKANAKKRRRQNQAIAAVLRKASEAK